MESTHDPSATRGGASPIGELVVQNGRLAGTRRPLGAPLTFLGKAAGCDVRLNVDGVQSLHCLIADGPDGFLVRDLDSDSGTFVNGERVTTYPLRDGDQLAIGPFQFRLRLAARPMGQSEEASRKEKEALRIQAAAVAAQQAALADEEARLAQRRSTLEQQEGQLAAHLEDKRRRLMQVAEHAQAARAALQKEKADYAKHVEKVTSHLGEAQRELLESQQKAQTERQRFANLRRRFKQRWHRHWMAERKTVNQQQEAVAAERRRLEKANERLQQEKDALGQARLRANGEAELGRRQHQADRDALHADQALWAGQCAQAEAELTARERALVERESALADGGRLLEDEKYRWEKGLGLLKRETEGLEARIHNQRRKIIEQRQEINALEARLRGLQAQAAQAVPPTGAAAGAAVVEDSPTTPGEELVPLTAVEANGPTVPGSMVVVVAATEPRIQENAPGSAAGPTASEKAELARALVPASGTILAPAAPLLTEVLGALGPAGGESNGALAAKEAELRELETALRRRIVLLERLAEGLADQRLLLSEQWERLAALHHAWHQDRRAALAELEDLAAHLPGREEALSARARALEIAEDDLRRRHQESVHLRQHLEGWKARLHIHAAGWESERDRTLADLRSREGLTERHLATLVELRQRWNKRRRQELDVVRAERAACERLRQECATLREDLWRRGNTLEEERRALAEKTLALEQYRQQYVVRAADAASAERRVERLRRRWATQNANLVRATVSERQALQEEVARLEDQHTALHKQMEALAVREAHLAQRQTAWEEAQALTEAQQAKLQQELQSMQAQRDRYALHLMELQDEVERIARILLEEPDVPLLGALQAA